MTEHVSKLMKTIGVGVVVPVFAVVNFFACQPAVPLAYAGESTTVAVSALPAKAKAHWPQTVTIPSGAMMRVSLNSTLRTDREKSGDGFVARLCEPVRVNDITVLPSGTRVRGHLLLVAEPYTTAGKAQMTLAFDQIVDPSGRILDISAMPIVFVGEGNQTGSKATSAKLSPVRAEFGATAGGVIVLATTSEQIELPSNQRFSIQLDESLQVSVAELTASK